MDSIKRQGSPLWCMYHKVSGQYVKGLRGGEVHVLAAALSEDEKMNWLVWREGWAVWQELAEIHELGKWPSRSLVDDPPPLPEQGFTFGGDNVTPLRPPTPAKKVQRKENTPAPTKRGGYETTRLPTDTTIGINDPLPEGKASKFIVRAHRRSRKRIPIEIECNGQVFKTYTIDVSIGGILVEDPLPEWIAGYCTVVLKNHRIRKAIELNCSIVEDNQENTGRYRLSILPLKGADTVSKLQNWFDAA